MAKSPFSHGKTHEEVAAEVRVHLLRISRRRKRFRAAVERNLRETRQRIVEAVAAGFSVEDVATRTGYGVRTVQKWLAKGASVVRPISAEKAWERIERIHLQRHHTARLELKISARARGLVRKAVQVGITAEEFAGETGFTLKTTEKWFAAAHQSLEQAQRQREVAAVRRGKRNRPPQHLSLAERARWLVNEAERRKATLAKHGFSPESSSGSGTGQAVPTTPRLPRGARRSYVRRGGKRKQM